ncbi:nephrocystin-4 [Trichonephila clavipes]|nr:nephrocystin-4 [Trichonephila clavipes]
MTLNKDPSCLGNSKDIAIRRLNSLWKQLSRYSRYLSLYAEFLKEFEELGHLERVVESISETLLYDTYIDDIVSGVPDLETAQQLQSQLKDALQSCGMNLHKWSSNSPELLNSSLSSDVEHSFSTDIDLPVKTLGISWKPFEDCFVFKVSVSGKHIYTKREVLSVIAKLYDPLGFLGPVIVKAKVFLQQLWQCKLDWDDVLPNSIANEWKEFVTTLKCIEEVKINRFIMAHNNVKIVLQGFADASEAAYGVVVYLQCFLHNGAAKVSILASKSRVAPIRVISIPRLKLCACVLLAQLIKKIHSTLRLNISDIVLHTDSTIALAWLNTPANRLKTFVANRVAKVQELTEGFQWNHVPSVLNRADLVSRGLRPCDLPNLRLWWHGPQFLEKGKLSSEETSLSPVKECEYSKELKTGSSSDIITSSVCVSTNCVSSILSTLLCKNSDGLLRVGGWLSNSDLPYVNKHPAILPGNHNLTVQIIAHFHRKNLHTGASSFLHYLMGNLPCDRVVPDYPFNYSAIHIEIVSDLTSDAFIATLKRFFSHISKCAKLYSDNGKTFVGANKEPKRFLKLIEDSDDNLAGFLSAEGIEWKFIPPRAPSFGGLWEASVKSINIMENLDVPPEVFFTFQFYRFLPIRSECMLLKPLSEDTEGVPKSSLVYAFLKTPERGKLPGFQISYNIDPTELNKGEFHSFLLYLMKQNLHIDMWNGKSLLYIGTVVLPLKYFCRQGKEAVVSKLELDIFNCEYPDESLGQVSMPTKTPLGKLHLRVASIRHPLSAKALENFEEMEENLNSVIISSRVEKPRTGMMPYTVSKAKRLADTNRELSHLLSTRSLVGESKSMTPNPQLTEERRRKLARMEAVRNLENNNQTTEARSDGMQYFFKERQRDLLSIETYIQKNKSELIQSFLHKSVTSEKRIYPLVGSKTFFEFIIENPFPVAKKVEIVWKSPELNLVMDSKEWQTLRTMNSISQSVKPLSFVDSSQEIPTIQLLPNEKVHIPFTYQCSLVQISQLDLFKAVSGHYFTAEVLSSVPALNSLDSSTKVRFTTEDQTLLAVLNLTVQPLPPSFTHIFKFLSMEHSMFKKSIQISRDTNTKERFTVKCTNSDAVCSIQENQNWEENVNVSIKAPTKAAGRCTEFYVFIYKDKYQITPFQSWGICVCPLQRIDLSCVAGQLMRSSLLIRGTHATNLVRCSSNSKDLQLHPSEPFVLSPFAAQELSMNIRSLIPGVKYFQITMVNQALEQILQSWLLVLSCQKPSVTKAFQVHLTIGKETAKRITCTNPYPQDRRFILHSSHPHLLQLREYEFSVAAGKSYLLGLYFLPQNFIFTETVFLYLNDAVSDKNEETYCIKVVCQ